MYRLSRYCNMVAVLGNFFFFGKFAHLFFILGVKKLSSNVIIQKEKKKKELKCWVKGLQLQ